MKNEIKRCYTANGDGMIKFVKDLVPQKRKKDKEKEDYEVADIYPAFKLIMSLMLLISYFPIFSSANKKAIVKFSLEEYMRMLAAYVLYVNLFNTFCGVRMDKSWNDTIKNQYVYFFHERGNVENVNVQDILLYAVKVLEGESKADDKFGDDRVKLGELTKEVSNYERLVDAEFKEHGSKLKKSWPMDEIKSLIYDSDEGEVLLDKKYASLQSMGREAVGIYRNLHGQDKPEKVYYNYVIRLCKA